MFKANDSFLFKSAILSVVLTLSACSSNPPKDARDEQFGSGLPESRNQTIEPPYETQPVFEQKLPGLNDQDDDGVIDKRDQCVGKEPGVSVDNVGCEKTLSALRTIDLNIEFPSGSAVIGDAYQSSIKQLAKVYSENPEFIILIEGHTDNTGARVMNLELSKARAKAVAQTLIERFNVSEQNILISGFGPDRPVASNDSSEGRKKNRRMVAHVVSRDRFLTHHYNIWTVELGSKSKSEKRIFEAM